MDSVSDNIKNVVALLTAITSEQQELAYTMVLESDPVQLFSTITGVLLSTIGKYCELTGITTEDFLKNLGMFAINHNDWKNKFARWHYL